MTPTTVTPRHRAANADSRARELAKDYFAALCALGMFAFPFLTIGAIILAALLTDGGR